MADVYGYELTFVLGTVRDGFDPPPPTPLRPLRRQPRPPPPTPTP